MAVREERAAAAGLAAARAVLRATAARTTSAVRALRAAGVSTTALAAVVARESGLAPSVSTRRRIAARLRQRLARGGVTRGHADLDPEASPPGPAPLTSDEAKEAKMEKEKLIRRTTVTEEFIEAKGKKAAAKAPEDPEPDEETEGDDDPLGDLDDVEEDEPAPRRSRRRSR